MSTTGSSAAEKQAMIPTSAALLATASKQKQQRDRATVLKKGGMSDTVNNRSSPTSSPSASASRAEGLQQVLEAEASRQRAGAAFAARASATAGAASRAAALRASAFSQRDQLLAAAPPSLRASQSLDMSASMPPSLRPSQSLDLTASVPPSLRPAQSLDLGPPGLGRGTSLGGATGMELAAARRAAALGAYPGSASSMMYDQRRRYLLAQQAAAAAAVPHPHAALSGGPMFGVGAMGAGAMFGAMGAAGPWRNMPNEGVSGQGLELLRAASLSVPNRLGMGMPGGMGMPMPGMAGLGGSAAAAAAAARRLGPMAGGLGGRAASLSANHKLPGFSPEPSGSPSRKRKANDDGNVSEDEEGGDKVFIPEIRDLDILCGRGGKSNHHFGNKRYRQVVSEMKMMYRSTEAKTVKTDLSRAIVDHVCSYGGRFVKKDDTAGKYYLLTKAEARKKTSQALRETKALKWTM